jgi:hypothetical protein
MMGEWGEINELGKALVMIGVVVAVFGALLMFHENIPFFGKLPGDIHIKRENFTFYFPITTMIIISIIVSFVFILFRK